MVRGKCRQLYLNNKIIIKKKLQWLVTKLEEGAGRSSYSTCRRGMGWLPTLDVCTFLRNFALTKNGSRKRVKDTGELAKMVTLTHRKKGQI